MPTGQNYLVKLSYSVSGIKCSNTFIWQEGQETGEQDICGDCLAAVGVDIAPQFQAMMSTDVQLSSMQCWAIKSSAPPALTVFVGAFGSIVSPACPANKNMKFRLRQEHFSTRTNGELRVAGIPETHTEGNIYTGPLLIPAVLDDLLGHFVGVITSPVGDNATYKLVLASSGLEAVAEVGVGNTPVYSDVKQASVASRVYSDRRRTSKFFFPQTPPL